MTELIAGFMAADYMQMINAGCHAERKGRGRAGVGWYHGGGVGQIYVNQCHCAPADK